MAGLNLFPARVAIGQDESGRPVYASPEFFRALSQVFERIGGADAYTNTELELIASLSALGDSSHAQVQSEDEKTQAIFAAVPADSGARAEAEYANLISSAFGSPEATEQEKSIENLALLISAVEQQSAYVKQLESEVSALKRSVSANESAMARIAELSKAIDEIRAEQGETAASYMSELQKAVNAAEVTAMFDYRPTDWEHPGKIGAAKANTGAFTTLSTSGAALLNGAASTGTGFGTVGNGCALFKSYTGGSPGISLGASGAGYGELGYNIDYQSSSGTYKYIIADTAQSIQFNGANMLFKGAASGSAGAALTFTTWATLNSGGFQGTPIGATTASTGRFTSIDITTGGSTTISTGVGSILMSTANNRNNAVWIPIAYDGSTYYVPGWLTNAP